MTTPTPEQLSKPRCPLCFSADLVKKMDLADGEFLCEGCRRVVSPATPPPVTTSKEAQALLRRLPIPEGDHQAESARQEIDRFIRAHADVEAALREEVARLEDELATAREDALFRALGVSDARDTRERVELWAREWNESGAEIISARNVDELVAKVAPPADAAARVREAVIREYMRWQGVPEWATRPLPEHGAGKIYLSDVERYVRVALEALAR